MDNYEWLNSLKKDDEVVVCSGAGMGCPYDLAVVTNVTKTQIQVALKRYKNAAYKFRRDGGSQIGGDIWHSKSLKPVTEEISNYISAYNTKNRIHLLLKTMSESTNKLPIDGVLLKKIYSCLYNASILYDSKPNNSEEGENNE